MNQDAKAYFPSTDVVFTTISNMKTTYNTSGVAAATPLGFDILKRTEMVRRESAEIGTGAAGGTFVLDVVACMDVGSVPGTFDPGTALTSGVFAVRGDVASDSAALAYNAAPGTTTSLTTPMWGAEAPGTNGWLRPASVAPYGRYLISGYPLSGGVLTSGFELGTLPTTVGASTSALFRVGMCVHQANSSTTAANRLVHLGTILTGTSSTAQGTAFCYGQSLSAANSTWIRRLADKALSFFSPKSAFAQGDFTDGIGGLPSGWSPFNFNPIAGSSVNLQFGPLPKNVSDSVYFYLTVHASTTVNSANTPVPGAVVSLSIFNNSGSPAQAVLIGDTTAVTQANGDATFYIAIGKPGGYTLTAAGTLSGVTTNSTVSALFNIKN